MKKTKLQSSLIFTHVKKNVFVHVSFTKVILVHKCLLPLFQKHLSSLAIRFCHLIGDLCHLDAGEQMIPV